MKERRLVVRQYTQKSRYLPWNLSQIRILIFRIWLKPYLQQFFHTFKKVVTRVTTYIFTFCHSTNNLNKKKINVSLFLSSFFGLLVYRCFFFFFLFYFYMCSLLKECMVFFSFYFVSKNTRPRERSYGLRLINETASI